MIESAPLCFESCKLQIITQSRQKEDFTCLALYFMKEPAKNVGGESFFYGEMTVRHDQQMCIESTVRKILPLSFN